MPGGLAARVEGWRRHLGAWPDETRAGPLEGAAFPDAPLDLGVAIWVDGSWIDLTPFVYGGNRSSVEITRGQANEGGQVDPARVTLQLNNRGGQFTPRNPLSWLYGKIGRNTMIRVTVGADTRFCGEVVAWPQRWDKTGADVYVPLEAAGILRRLQQGGVPLSSVLYRAHTSRSGSQAPRAYWPVEDAEGSTSIAAAAPSGTVAMQVIGTPNWATETGFKSSAALPTFANSIWRGQVPLYTGTGTVVWTFLLALPDAGSTDNKFLGSVGLAGPGSTLQRFEMFYRTGGDLHIKAITTSETEALTQVVDLNLDGLRAMVYFEAVQNGANVDWELRAQSTVQDAILAGTSGTIAAQVISRAVDIKFNNGGDHDDVTVGHAAIYDYALDTADLADQVNAYSGETAGRRIERLCDEEGVDLVHVGDLDDTTEVGAQTPRTLADLLREAADADGGFLYEAREVCAIAYRTRESIYNQQATLTLDYSAAHLSAMEPTDDDQNIKNDVTVQRVDGSSFRKVEESGPLSVQDPPDGVGRYDDSVSLSLASDTQLQDQAGWRLLLGTIDEARYPVLAVNLARAPFVADPALVQGARALDVGDRLVVENPPAWLPPFDIAQLALGFREVLGNFEHTIDINCAPSGPWDAVGVYEPVDLTDSRYTSDGSTLAADLDTTSTSVSVATANGPLWAHNDGDFDVVVGGEQLTVTAVAGATSPQTFTVTRSINGIVKSHLTGAVLELAHPVVYAI